MAAQPQFAEERGGRENPAPRELLALVEETSFRALGSVLAGIGQLSARRKSSKSVTSHWMLDIMAICEPRTLALTATIYFENFVERHLRHDSQLRRQKPIAVEIDRLASDGRISQDLRDDMKAIVKLRNEFAHNLFYDISDWEPLSSPFLAKIPPRMPKPRHLRQVKNMVLVKILLMSILFRLHDSFPWLTFEDVPKDFERRSNKSLQPTPHFVRSG